MIVDVNIINNIYYNKILGFPEGFLYPIKEKLYGEYTNW